MEKKNAIAVDGSVHTSMTMRYAAGLTAVISEVRYVLWHIQPTISQIKEIAAI